MVAELQQQVPKRRGRPPLTLADAEAAAEARGGECTSTVYTKSTVNLGWRCSEGHEWEATLASVRGCKSRKGTWCRQCDGRGRPPGTKNVARPGVKLGRKPLTLADAVAAAEKRGGRCLSTTYSTSLEKLQWQCAQNHLPWEASLNSVRNQNTWCPRCRFHKREAAIRSLLEEWLGPASSVSRPDWTKTEQSRWGLELDIHYPELGFAIEVQGDQHRRWVKWFHRTEEDFEAQKRRDALKREYCESQWTVLIEIWEEDDAETVIGKILPDIAEWKREKAEKLEIAAAAPS